MVEEEKGLIERNSDYKRFKLKLKSNAWPEESKIELKSTIH